MKYIITESKLEETIISYFDELFDIQDLHWTHPYDYDDETGEEGEDESRIEFYIGDYQGTDEGCFRYYFCDYFQADSRAIDECPIISLESQYTDTLNSYFGDRWHEPFKKWFAKNFDLPVKTIE
jgi:hypothetical protein